MKMCVSQNGKKTKQKKKTAQHLWDYILYWLKPFRVSLKCKSITSEICFQKLISTDVFRFWEVDYRQDVFFIYLACQCVTWQRPCDPWISIVWNPVLKPNSKTTLSRFLYEVADVMKLLAYASCAEDSQYESKQSRILSATTEIFIWKLWADIWAMGINSWKGSNQSRMGPQWLL